MSCAEKKTRWSKFSNENAEWWDIFNANEKYTWQNEWKVKETTNGSYLNF